MTRPQSPFIALVASIVLGVCTPGEPFAQNQAPPPPDSQSRFERIGNQSGPSHNSVLAITQDREGFLWFGTADGLNRYDGYEFVVYRHDPRDSTSLSHNTVTALLEDTEGRFWVGTENGLNQFDRAAGHFSRTPISPVGYVPGVLALFEEAGALWAGLACGLVRYEPDTDHVEANDCWPERPDQYSFYRHSQGPDRVFWLGTDQRLTEQGLYRFRIERGEYEHVSLPEDWRPTQSVSVHVGHSGTVWVGGDHVVGRFDSTTQRLEGLPIRGSSRRAGPIRAACQLPQSIQSHDTDPIRSASHRRRAARHL